MSRSMVKWLPGCLVVIAIGCGDSGYRFAPVEGKVVLNNQPLAGASIEFQPIGGSSNSDPGPGSIATTDAEGRFKLHSQLDLNQFGAVVAKHRVRIWVYPPENANEDLDADSSRPGKGKSKKTVLIPPRYNSETKLSCDVPKDGMKDLVFELTTP